MKVSNDSSFLQAEQETTFASSQKHKNLRWDIVCWNGFEP